MKGKPNIDAFLAGGKADSAEAAPVVTPVVPSPVVVSQPQVLDAPTPQPEGLNEPRITKTIRIAKSLDNKLKREAFKRSMATGRKVAESDLIEEALMKYFIK